MATGSTFETCADDLDAKTSMMCDRWIAALNHESTMNSVRGMPAPDIAQAKIIRADFGLEPTTKGT